MAFSMKKWANRISEYPNRRRLTHENGESEIVTVTREEGQVSAEGDAFSEKEMNDLEQRIADEFGVLDERLNGIDPAFSKSLTTRNQYKDFLQINPNSRNDPAHEVLYFGADSPGVVFANSPVTDTPFYGYRVVRWNSPVGANGHLITVELHEQYPVAGRVWANTYDKGNSQWYGWKCETETLKTEMLKNKGNAFIDVGTVLKGFATIPKGATATYTANRDCFVNVSAYAHGEGQCTKIYINNVCIFTPYTNNGNNAGLIIVQKTIPLKSGQTIRIENGTYTTSDYVVYAAF